MGLWVLQSNILLVLVFSKNLVFGKKYLLNGIVYYSGKMEEVLDESYKFYVMFQVLLFSYVFFRILDKIFSEFYVIKDILNVRCVIILCVIKKEKLEQLRYIINYKVIFLRC